MLLNELVGYKKDYLSHFNELDDDHTKLGKFMSYLMDKGFTRMGQGSYGLVFTHPNIDYCVKIFRPDKGYRLFLKFCSENPGNPHLPTIKGQLSRINNTYSAIRMERLEPLTLSSEEQMIRSLSMLADYPSTEEFIQRFSNTKSKTFEYYSSQPRFVETYQQLTAFAGSQVEMDLKKENVMKRGQIYVFIDPYY